MSKPEDIPQDVWDEAFLAMPPISREAYERSPFSMVLHLGFARAIMAAEKRGEEREREACAELASDYQPTPSLLPFTTDEMNEAAAVGQDFAADEIAAAIRKRGE